MTLNHSSEINRGCKISGSKACVLLLAGFLAAPYAAESAEEDIPEQFLELLDAIPSITLDVRYSGSDNFVGSPIDGYLAEKIYVEQKAAGALAAAQTELREFRLGLKVFDAYRPQRAVDHFVRWERALDDEKMKPRYYPEVDKANLFRDGYIAERSGHSRGSTVDLTLVDLGTAEELDMGTSWDYFDVKSWPSSQAVTAQQRANRMLLHRVMVKQGFRGLRTEWWHFTLEDETFPDTYFDFEIK